MKQGLAGYLILCYLSALSLSVVVSSWSSRLKQRRPLCKNTAPVLAAQLNGQAASDIVPPTGQRWSVLRL